MYDRKLFQTEDLVQNQNNMSLESFNLSKELYPDKIKVNDTTQENLEINIRNDITYLQNLKNSASLPYLKHIQVKDQEENPLKSYI